MVVLLLPGVLRHPLQLRVLLRLDQTRRDQDGMKHQQHQEQQQRRGQQHMAQHQQQAGCLVPPLYLPPWGVQD